MKQKENASAYRTCSPSADMRRNLYGVLPASGSLHPQDDIITRGEFAAMLVRDIPLDTTNAEKDPPSFPDIDVLVGEKH